ncbi:CPBP family intramembrane glutamic endopeptidase [Nitrospina sp. 32_T5]|uniref:CPBP family intramembrane glutamic endopeptidase n=1 Tax=unclassified Nitrospina TaxID=2638683 RepID=UPI003F97CCB1
MKGPAWSLAGYICLVYPLVHLLVRDPHRFSAWMGPVYFGLVLTVVWARKKATLAQLGFAREAWVRHGLVGGLPGLLLAGAVPLLDAFIENSGLDQTELFAGAENRAIALPSVATLTLIAVGQVLFTPVIEQVFFTGFLLPALFRVGKPMTAIYFTAALFALVHFDIRLSLFLIGLVCSGLFYWTGTLWASLFFHMGCALGGWLVTYFYPRVVTFLAFLL